MPETDFPFDIEFGDVVDFHQKFGLNVHPEPFIPSKEVIDFRAMFLQEELDEFKEGFETQDITKMVDSLIDLVYVAKGTADMMGISNELWCVIWNRVQEANMSKKRAETADESKRGSSLDVVKPDGWVSPDSDIERYIIEAGYNQSEV